MGHIVIVEAKLGDNPELRGRQVIAQVVEYAASVANLSDEALLTWLRADDERWADFVARTFRNAKTPDLLAAELRRRMRDAELHLVIVCDRAPAGLRDLVRAVAGQAALGAFTLRVVELTPYVAEGVPGILLVPAVATRTEIVSRTAITVSYAEEKQPGVTVVASSAEEVAEAVAEVRAGRTMRPEFAAVIAEYDALAPEDLRTSGQASHYRQVQPSGWPGSVHYEFLDRRRDASVGIELHVEGKLGAAVSAGLELLAKELGATHDPQWSRGLGRLQLSVPLTDANGAARAMLQLIEQTRARVTALLNQGQP
jgi:hypothetical protein